MNFSKHFFTNFFKTAFLFTTLFSVMGCSKYSVDNYTVSSKPLSYQSRYPIRLDRKEQILDIPVFSKSIVSSTLASPTPASSTLSNLNRTKILNFAKEFSQRPSGKLSIMVPRSSVSSATALKLRDEIVMFLTSTTNTLSSSNIRLMDYDAKRHKRGAPIRLSYHRVTPMVRKCGKWGDLTEVSENRNYRNFGCATQNNLAAMLQDPSDLEGPRAVTDIDAARRSRVIDDYRNALEPNTPDRTYTPIDRVEF